MPIQLLKKTIVKLKLKQKIELKYSFLLKL